MDLSKGIVVLPPSLFFSLFVASLALSSYLSFVLFGIFCFVLFGIFSSFKGNTLCFYMNKKKNHHTL